MTTSAFIQLIFGAATVAASLYAGFVMYKLVNLRSQPSEDLSKRLPASVDFAEATPAEATPVYVRERYNLETKFKQRLRVLMTDEGLINTNLHVYLLTMAAIAARFEATEDEYAAFVVDKIAAARSETSDKLPNILQLNKDQVVRDAMYRNAGTYLMPSFANRRPTADIRASWKDWREVPADWHTYYPQG